MVRASRDISRVETFFRNGVLRFYRKSHEIDQIRARQVIRHIRRS